MSDTMESNFRRNYSFINFNRTWWSLVYTIFVFALGGVYDHFVIVDKYVMVFLVRYLCVFALLILVGLTWKLPFFRYVIKCSVSPNSSAYFPRWPTYWK